jgi:predicted CXXCH cytochrome family protein
MLLLCLFPAVQSSAYEDKECLVCHKDYGRAGETLPEGVSNLYVDEEEWKKDVHFDAEQWKKDVHAEVAGLACDDCHLDATPETHPEGGLQKVNCAECHEDDAAAYYKTIHWTAEVPEGKQKPDCADCHISHATRSKQDPESSVYRGKVKAICLSCHEEMASSFKLSNRLLLFRISAHRKSDLASHFDRSECINCHFSAAVGHGEDPLTETHCGQCHMDEDRAGKVLFGPFHLDPSLQDRPIVLLVVVVNILIILALLASLILWLIRGFARPRGSKAAQEPGG